MITDDLNEQGQRVGNRVVDWTTRARPPSTPMVGRYCRVEPLSLDRHADELFQSYSADQNGEDWTYLAMTPARDLRSYRESLTRVATGSDRLFHTIISTESGLAGGVAAFMHVDPANGVMEVGGIHYSRSLRRTPAATEAMYLMMRRAFDELGYRRYEWRTDRLNTRSSAAAERLGFRFEGILRQAAVRKGRNRDTAIYSVIDPEWPSIKAALEQWLEPSNFDEVGQQRTSLAEIRESLTR